MPSQRSLPNKPYADAGLDSVKGLLILLVVFGHMHAVQFAARPVYDLLYIFHVAGFLVLPFLIPSPVLSKAFIAKRFIRYAVPFFWFFSLSSVLYYMLYTRPEGVTIARQIFDYILALTIASTVMLDAASGLKLFWFLPTLFTLTLLRALWQSLPPKARPLMLAACVAVNLVAGDFGPWRYYLPWGVIIAILMFPVGLLTIAITRSVTADAPSNTTKLFKGLMLALSIELLILSHQTGITVNLGDISLYGIFTHPWLLLIYEATMIIVIATIILYQGVWQKISGLIQMGRLSLSIYLIHAFVNEALERIIPVGQGSTALLRLCLTFPIVIIVATSCAMLLARTPALNKCFIPRDYPDMLNGIHLLLKKLKPTANL